MRLHHLTIEGFRRWKHAEVLFGEGTFLIGPNNSGKSSVLAALEALLSGTTKLPEADFYAESNPDTGDSSVATDQIVITAEFRDLPAEATEWRGFKSRVFRYDVATGSSESGLAIFYRKTFVLGKAGTVEMRSRKRKRKSAFSTAKTPQDFIDAGLPAELVSEHFSDLGKKINAKATVTLEAFDEIWEVEEGEEWFKNPGGIPGNVLSRLPRFLRIPAEASASEIDGKSGALDKTLKELFQDVRSASSHYKAAQEHLNELAKELDPEDKESEFGKMMTELNQVLSRVFPDGQLHASADMSDPDRALAPTFSVEMSSNVRTPISHQGTGMIRAAVFGLLRYRHRWLSKRAETAGQRLIIGFEEPEIYLHPSAANAMRDTIYELAGATSQIVATTHSPFLIDLSRKPRQVLNRCGDGDGGLTITAFSASDAFASLQDNDRSYVKMLMKLDDYVSRVFFTKTAIIVEGDTEEIAIRQALSRLESKKRTAIANDFEVIRARGKGTIIGLAKYLRALGIDFRIIHDADASTPGAVVMNAPILTAAADPAHVFVLDDCLEDALGYDAPRSNKPHRAFVASEGWGDDWSDVPTAWRTTLEGVFAGYLP